MVAARVTVRGLLLHLCSWQQKTWIRFSKGNEPHQMAYRAWEMLKTPWPPLTERDIETAFASSGATLDLFAMGKALYLPPLVPPLGGKLRKLQFAPVLTLRCNLDQECTGLELRVMLVSCGDDSLLNGLGFRMEFGKDNHGFYHAQLLRDFRTSGHERRGPPIGCLQWLPETQPSFPLPARNSVALILTMLISLYGTNYFEYVDATSVVGIERYQSDVMTGVRP